MEIDKKWKQTLSGVWERRYNSVMVAVSHEFLDDEEWYEWTMDFKIVGIDCRPVKVPDLCFDTPRQAKAAAWKAARKVSEVLDGKQGGCDQWQPGPNIKEK